MKKSYRPILLSLTFVVVGFQFAMSSLSENLSENRRYSITEKRTIPWEQNRPVYISEKEGSVFIKGHEKKEIELKAIKTAFAESISLSRRGAAILRVSVEVPRDRILIKTVRKSALPYNVSGFIDYSLKTPEKIDLDIKTETGSVAIEKIEGKTTIQTASGTVFLKELGGEISAKVEKGNLRIIDCKGLLNVTAGTGDILFSTRLTETTDGSTLKTDKGNIEVQIPKELSVTFDVFSGAGEIDTLDTSMSESGTNKDSAPKTKRGKGVFSNNKGGPIITISAASGKVTIKYKKPKPEKGDKEYKNDQE